MLASKRVLKPESDERMGLTPDRAAVNTLEERHNLLWHWGVRPVIHPG